VKARHFIQQHTWLLIALGCVLLAAAIFGSRPKAAAGIDSYAACIEAGYPVVQTDPPICRYGARSFTGTPAPLATPGPSVQSVDFEILVDGDTHGQLPTHRQDVIDSQAQWQAYWREVHASLATLPPIIPVDFTHFTVVAASLGTKPTGGYELKITGVTSSATGSVVSLTETAPARTCPVVQSLSNRYLVVRAEKLQSPVVFRITNQEHTCQ
jgi:hypothetical protein